MATRFRYILTIGIIAALSGMPGIVHAATQISFEPSDVTVVPGESFTLAVYVNPDTEEVFTISSALSFPADLVSVTDFAFADNWQPLTMGQYDRTNNTTGMLVKTGGYPGGVSTLRQIGTVTFTARQTGAGTIAGTDDTFAYNRESQDVSADTHDAATVTVVTPQNTPEEADQGQPQQTAATTTDTQRSTTTGPASPSTQQQAQGADPEDQQAGVLAAVGDAVTLGTGQGSVSVMLLLAALGLGYGLHRFRRRSE
jgi:hypothetical protein